MIISEKKLQKILSTHSAQKVVFASGVFDLLHIGHLKYLQESKKLGDLLVVWVDSDQRVQARKGRRRPIIPQKQRMQIIDSLKGVDYVLPFNEEKPLRILKKFKPHFVVRSGKCQKENIVHQLVEKYGGKMYYVDKIPSISTTKIINQIKKQ